MPKSPSLLCLFPLGSELRQFGHSGLFARLLDLGWRVVVAAKIPDEDLRAQLDPRVEIMDLPLERLPFGLVHLTTALLDRSHAERERRHGKSGWQYGKVVPHNWKERMLYAAQAVLGNALSFSPSAQKLWSTREAAAIRNLFSPKCEGLLRSVNPDVILLNVPRSEALLPLLSAAQARKIPVVLLYHTWKDVVAQGRVNFPFTRYGVWSERMQAELLRQNPGIDPRTVSLTGCAHFQCVGRQDLLLPEARFRSEIGVRPNSRLILFPASAPWMVPQEERYIRLLKNGLAGLKTGGDVQIVVRVNPMDAEGRLADVLRADAPDVLVSTPDWRWDKKRNWCFQRRSDQVLYNSLLHHASACVGMPSTVTVECAVADVPIINLGFDLPGPAAQPGSVRKVWEADFYEEVRQTGAAKLVESPGNLVAAVAEALAHPELGRHSRHRLLERQLGIAPHAAVEAAVKVILECSDSSGVTRPGSPRLVEDLD
jgi:hypothetical protein